MSDEKRLKREVLEIVLAATAGDATEEQRAQLSAMVVSDPALARYAVELMNQEAWLNWHGSQISTRKLLQELTPGLEEEPVAADVASGQSRVGGRYDSTGEVQSFCELDASGNTPSKSRGISATPQAARRRLTSFLIAASLLAIGTLIGTLATTTLHRTQQLTAEAGTSLNSARFVQGTACVWGPGMQPRTENGRLRSGESLNLIEGLAEIELDLAGGGKATVQIEGPARMVLTAEGTPSLTLGKFCTDVHVGFEDFVLETPLGQVSPVSDSAFGVAVYGLEVEVHVFSGEVVVASPWTAEGNTLSRHEVKAGQSLRLAAADSQAVAVTLGMAEPVRFASRTSMGTDLLAISPDYVQQILAAQPLVYWRFEKTVDGSVPNEVGDKFRGIVFGSPGWAAQGDNRAIEFGVGLADEVLQARLESSESFGDEISDSYSIEAWVKPSHYHLGTLSSLVRHPVEAHRPAAHGALLELGGPLTTPSTIEHPGRIRFLHRDPPSDDVFAGTSCFSKGPYGLRRWEHVVAVKDGGEMRLYVDGELVATANDNTKLASDMTLLVGQLDRTRGWRRFVGQLDELAIYNRALSDGEIRAHFRLVRPQQQAPPSSI